MTRKTKLTREQIAMAKAMYERRVTFAEMERQFGVAGDTIKRAIIPGFAELRAAQIREAKSHRRKDVDVKEAAAARQAAGLRYPKERISHDEIEARLAEIPQFDTRDLTARFFGDPLPGRSALDRRSPT